MRVRFALLSGLAAGALLAPLAGAAPGPQIVDPRGDAVGGQAAYDILSVTFQTTNGAHADRELVGTIELAGPPDIAPGTSYVVQASDTPCGGFYMSVHWGALFPGPTTHIGPVTQGSYTYCGGPGDISSGPGAGYVPVRLAIEGNTLSLATPVASLPAEFKNGTLAGLSAHTAPADPLFGINMRHVGVTLDSASSDETYQLGQ